MRLRVFPTAHINRAEAKAFFRIQSCPPRIIVPVPSTSPLALSSRNPSTFHRRRSWLAASHTAKTSRPSPPRAHNHEIGDFAHTSRDPALTGSPRMRCTRPPNPSSCPALHALHSKSCSSPPNLGRADVSTKSLQELLPMSIFGDRVLSRGFDASEDRVAPEEIPHGIIRLA